MSSRQPQEPGHRRSTPPGTAVATAAEAWARFLFDRTRHLHGLTRTVRPRVLAAAASVAQPPSAVTLHQHVAQSPSAVALCQHVAQSPSAVNPHRHVAQSPSAVALRQPAEDADPRGLRVAAIAGLARALAACPGLDPADADLMDTGTELRLSIPAQASGARAAVREVAAAAGLWNELLPRPFAAVRLRRSARRPSPQPLGSPRRLGAHAVLRQLEHCLGRRYGLAFDDDPETVHEMRVALRRLRAALRVFAADLPALPESLARSLRDAARLLGRARDLDVFTDFLRDYADNARQWREPFVAHLIVTQEAARCEAYAALRSAQAAALFDEIETDHYGLLRASLGAWVAAARARGPAATAAAAPARLARPLGRVRNVAGGPLERRSARGLHRLRIRCKKLRYACEFFAPLGLAGFEAAIALLTRMQGLLGRVHDADLYAQRIKHLEPPAGERWGRRDRDARKRLLADLAADRKKALGQAQSAWEELLPALDPLDTKR